MRCYLSYLIEIYRKKFLCPEHVAVDVDVLRIHQNVSCTNMAEIDMAEVAGGGGDIDLTGLGRLW